MFSIRYLIKKDGDQIAFWHHNASSDLSEALKIAYKFGTENNNNVIMNSGWAKETETFYRMKLVYSSTDIGLTNFALHITVGPASDSVKSNL